MKTQEMKHHKTPVASKKSFHRLRESTNVEATVVKPLLMTSPRLSPSAESLLPVCDVQKRAEVSGGWGISGDVSREVDRATSRLVTRIRGTSGVANWVRMPRAPNELGLRSRYIYIQYRIDGERCSLELELSRGIGSQNFRLTLSKNSKEKPILRGGALCLSLPGTRGKWTTLVVDTEAAAECYTELLRHSRPSPGSISLRASTFRARLSVRGVWSSNSDYSERTAPIELSLRGKRAQRNTLSSEEDQSEWIRLFGGQAPEAAPLEDNTQEIQVVHDDVRVEGPSTPGGRSDILDESPTPLTRPQTATRRQLFGGDNDTPRPTTISLERRVARASASSRSALVWTARGRLLFASGRTLCALDEATSTRTARYHETRIDFMAVSEDGSRLVTAQNPGIATGGKIKAPLATIWATQNTEDEDSSLQWLTEWRPHDRSVITLCFSADGAKLCSCGLDTHARAQIIIWSIDRLLTPVPGASSRAPARTPTRPFELSQLGFAVVAKQLSDFDLGRIRWSAYEADALVSCGKENVRFWRIKRDHLPATPCALYEHARDTVFLDLAFEPSYVGGADLPDAAKAWRRGKQHNSKRGLIPTKQTQPCDFGNEAVTSAEAGTVIPGDKVVYVASSRGQVLQVSYAQRALLCVLRLHDGPVVAVEATPGYVMTASADGVARLWPLDFGEFLMEARHEAPLIDACVSRDGLRVACVTSKGALGVLDVASHSYATLQRAHVGAITDLSKGLGKHASKLASCAVDGSVRIWELSQNEDDGTLSVTQRAEFAAANDVPTRLAWRAQDSDHLAVGFRSGAVRIFDVEQLSSLHTARAHSSGAFVSRLAYAPCLDTGVYSSASLDGPKPLLYSAGSDGRIVAYDSEYAPLRVVPIDAALPPTLARGAVNHTVAIAVSPDGMTIASISDGRVHMLDALNLQRLPVPQLDDQAKIFVDVHWSDADYLWLTAADGVRICLFENHGCWYPKQRFVLDARQRKQNLSKNVVSSSRHASLPVTADAVAVSAMHLAGAVHDTAIEVARLPAIEQDCSGIKRLLAHRVDLAHSSPVTRVLFESEHRLISADSDGALCFWQVTDHASRPVDTEKAEEPLPPLNTSTNLSDNELSDLESDHDPLDDDASLGCSMNDITEKAEAPRMTIAMPVAEYKEEVSDVEGIIPPDSVLPAVAAVVAVKHGDATTRGAAALLHRFESSIADACWHENTGALIAAEGSRAVIHFLDGPPPRRIARPSEVILVAAAEGLVAAATTDSLAVYDLAEGELCFEESTHAIAAMTFRKPGVQHKTFLMSLDRDGHLVARNARRGAKTAAAASFSDHPKYTPQGPLPALCSIRGSSDTLLAATMLSLSSDRPLRVYAWQKDHHNTSLLTAVKAWTLAGSNDASSGLIASPDGDAAFLVACDTSGALTILPLSKDDDRHSRFEVIKDSEHQPVVALDVAGDRYRGYTIAVATLYRLLLFSLDTTHTSLVPTRMLRLYDSGSPVIALSCDSCRARHGIIATSDGTILYFNADNIPENDPARQQKQKIKNIKK